MISRVVLELFMVVFCIAADIRHIRDHGDLHANRAEATEISGYRS